MASDFANATFEWGGSSITLLQRIKDLLGVIDNSQDDELSMYLEIAGQACERYIDNIIDQRSVTQNISHNRSPVVLRYYPAGNLTSVIVDGVESVSDYTVGTDDGIVWVFKSACDNYRDGCFKQLSIVYDAGFDPIPPDLAEGIVRAGISYQTETVATAPLKKEVINGVGSLEYDTALASTTNVGTLPAATIAVLTPYKRFSC